MLTRKGMNGFADFGQGGVQGNGRRANAAGAHSVSIRAQLYTTSAETEAPEGDSETEDSGSDAETPQPEESKPETPGTEEVPVQGIKSQKKGKRAWLWVAIGAAVLWLAWVLFVKKR